MSWYVLFVVTGQEEYVKESLYYRFKKIENDIQFVVPKIVKPERKQGVLKEVEKTLLPGYVLIEGEIGVDEYYMLKSIPGLVKLLRPEKILTKASGLEHVKEIYDNPKQYFAAIPEDEITILGLILKNGETIGVSTILLEEGDKIRVVEGPLLGMEGVISKIDFRKSRAKVKLTLLGSERMVDFAIKVLEK